MIPSVPQVSKNLREFLLEEFRKLQQAGDHVITITSTLTGVFERITSPNEFAGPLVEAWAHIHFSMVFEKYTAAVAGGQEFADASAEYQGQQVLLNIKAKDRRMASRSRINLSSFQRYGIHYTVPNPANYYVIVFEYEWQSSLNELRIIIERLKFTFNLLEIPATNYKIEGSSEGSYRIFISPIPDSARTESTTYSIMTPMQFLQRLEELRTAYNSRKSVRIRN